MSEGRGRENKIARITSDFKMDLIKSAFDTSKVIAMIDIMIFCNITPHC